MIKGHAFLLDQFKDLPSYITLYEDQAERHDSFDHDFGYSLPLLSSPLNIVKKKRRINCKYHDQNECLSARSPYMYSFFSFKCFFHVKALKNIYCSLKLSASIFFLLGFFSSPINLT